MPQHVEFVIRIHLLQVYTLRELCAFSLERFPLPLGALDGLRCFVVALPEPSIHLFLML